jgi:hypothetical protein
MQAVRNKARAFYRSFMSYRVSGGIVALAMIGAVWFVVHHCRATDDWGYYVDSWYNDSPEPIPWESEVPRSCILPVPTAHIKSAVALLQSEPAVHISLEQARTLLGIKRFEPDAWLERAAQEADERAKRREKESQMPALTHETAAKLKEWAAELRQTATKTRNLKGKLKTYLVRALYLNDGTGEFCACFQNSTLWMNHECLGDWSTVMQRRPVVVLLEQAPAKVYVSIGMDD